MKRKNLWISFITGFFLSASLQTHSGELEIIDDEFPIIKRDSAIEKDVLEEEEDMLMRLQQK